VTDASDYLPAAAAGGGPGALAELRRAAAGCRGCGLYRDATQTVFGEGEGDARLVLVGEQPGDREDRDGRPFVGPAGRLLDELLEEAGIGRGDVYVTNAVKHFRWKESRGKRRVHQSPTREQVRSCRPWLEAELAAISPALMVCLGATAAKAVIGPAFKVTEDRGKVLVPAETELGGADPGTSVLATLHPSALLRIREADERRRERDAVVADLRVARDYV
jgi:DNA polymerase